MTPQSPQQEPPLSTMMTGDSTPLDLVTIRATVRRALQERTALPRAEEVHEITRALRTHLWLMLPAAQAIADGLVRGTGPWHRWRALIDRVRVDLDHDGGSGLCSAVVHMKDLGRTCRFLADCLDE
ncbi:DUF6415 family natural product biosynthesis protein [Streptomyces syringium]|uniref:DUF6415 family natural product biosynthesis protein n=1 Tax=Streptomyces syringium TaxID=76729 RepID=UPI0037D94F53